MDAVEFVTKRKRMCETIDCKSCSLSYFNNGSGHSCTKFIADNPKQSVEIVEQWSKSHQRKTILDDLLEKYPNAQLEIDGTPKFCPRKLGYKTKPCCNKCDICWHTPLEEEK